MKSFLFLAACAWAVAPSLPAQVAGLSKRDVDKLLAYAKSTSPKQPEVLIQDQFEFFDDAEAKTSLGKTSRDSTIPVFRDRVAIDEAGRDVTYEETGIVPIVLKGTKSYSAALKLPGNRGPLYVHVAVVVTPTESDHVGTIIEIAGARLTLQRLGDPSSRSASLFVHDGRQWTQINSILSLSPGRNPTVEFSVRLEPDGKMWQVYQKDMPMLNPLVRFPSAPDRIVIVPGAGESDEATIRDIFISTVPRFRGPIFLWPPTSTNGLPMTTNPRTPEDYIRQFKKAADQLP